MGNELVNRIWSEFKIKVCVCVCSHARTPLFTQWTRASKNQESISTPPTGAQLGHFYSVRVSLLSHIKGKKYHRKY